MDNQTHFTGKGFDHGDFAPEERAIVREMVRELSLRWVPLDRDVVDKMDSAATVLNALVIISKAMAIVVPLGAALGVYFSFKG